MRAKVGPRVRGVQAERAEARQSLERRVSRIETAKRSERSWDAGAVLNLYGLYMRQASHRREKLKPYGPSPAGRRGASREFERHLRGFLRVASHPDYRTFERELIQTYRDHHPHSAAKEFEQRLQATLDKRPFDPEPRQAAEAQDSVDALIPITTCAIALGVHRATLHRWIDSGLIAVLHHGYPAVEKKGSRYYVNLQAAFEWKQSHARQTGSIENRAPNQRRSNRKRARACTKGVPAA